MLISLNRESYDRPSGKMHADVLLDDADGRRWERRTFEVRDAELAAWLSELRTSGVYATRVEGGTIAGVAPDPMAARSTSPGPDLSGSPVDDIDDEVVAVALRVRSALEERTWPAWVSALGENDPPPGSTPSVGMCRVSAPCLAAALAAEFPEGGWAVVGGHPSVAYPDGARQFSARWRGRDGGLWDGARQAWDGHYWVEGDRAGRRVVVDVSADQFGWGAVVVADAGDPRYRANYKGSTVAADMKGPLLKAAVEAFEADWSAGTPALERGVRAPGRVAGLS